MKKNISKYNLDSYSNKSININTNTVSENIKNISDTITNIPADIKIDFKINNEYSINEITNANMRIINNKPRQLSTSASNRKKMKSDSISKNVGSRGSFVTSNSKSFNVSEFDKNVSDNKFEFRNSLRKLNKLFEENKNLINYDLDDFNQLRISFSNQKNFVNNDVSSLGVKSKMITNSFSKKKIQITDE